MFNWDLYFVNPLIIIVSIICIVWALRKKNFEKKWILFFIEICIFWSAIAIISKFNLDNFNIKNEWINNNMILILFVVYSVSLIIFKPLATYLTAFFHQRRLWMWVANIAVIILFSLMLVELDTLSKGMYIFIAILVSFLLAFSVASQTLYIMFFHEQKYSKLFPFTSTFKVAILIALATTIGTYLYNINDLVLTKLNYDNYYVIAGAGIILMIGATALSFIVKENPANISGFDLTIKNDLEPFTKKMFINFTVLAFVFGVIYGLVNSPLYEMFVSANLQLSTPNNDVESVLSSMRRHQETAILVEPLILLFIYFLIIKKYGIKITMYGISAVLAVAALALSFSDSIIAIYICKTIFELSYSTMFFIFIGLALSWNYRLTKTFPLTGYIGGVVLLGTFVVQLIFGTLQVTHTGVFSDFANSQEILNSTNPDLIDNFLTKSRDVFFICGGLSFALILFFITYTKFTINPILGEWADIKQATILAIGMEKKNIVKKISTRVRGGLE